MIVHRLLVLPLFVLAGAAGAQSAPTTAKPVAALQACRAISDSAQRLACFDKAAAALDAATAAREVVIVDQQEVKRTRRGLFGFTLPRIGLFANRPGNKEDALEENELRTTIVSAQPLRYGKFRFTVEGGAVWETVEASTMATDPAPGAGVLIEKGTLGSYFAKVGKGRRLQAKRIG